MLLLKELPWNQSIESILEHLDMSNVAVRNNGGGYYNHCLWDIMGPNAGGSPSGDLAVAIDRDFGSFDAFKTETPMQLPSIRFRMGMVISKDDGKLEI